MTVATTVTRFGRREGAPCELLDTEIAEQCPSLLPPEPVDYDLGDVDVQGAEATVDARVGADDGDADRYRLRRVGDGWRIAAIE